MKKVFFTSIILTFMAFQDLSAQTDPAFKQNTNIGRAINLSWLENYWNGDANNKYANYIDFSKLPYYKKQIELIAQLGYKTVRLPVCFDIWEDQKVPYTIDFPQYWTALDSVVQWTEEQNLNLIIVNHHARLYNSNFQSEIIRLEAIWKQVANRYQNTDTKRIYFEIYNEPWDISADLWQIAAQSLTTTVRNICPNHTIIVGGVDWNSINGLKQFKPLIQKNIIYTFHFYDPFIFTHQGAEWVGDAVSTLGVPFPYNEEKMPQVADKAKGTWGELALNDYKNSGTPLYIFNTLQEPVSWAIQYNVPIFCGEWGSYKKADESSRCNHINAIVTALNYYKLTNAMWEFDQGFSYFYGGGDPDISKIPKCMADALKLTLTTDDKSFVFNNLAIDIYPNPIYDNQLNITQNEGEFDRLTVIDIFGTTHQVIAVEAFSLNIQLENQIPKGQLLLVFENSKDGTKAIKKLLKL